MSIDAYKYSNLIIVKNGLSSEGIRQIKTALGSITNKLIDINDVNGLSIPFHLTPNDLLVCHVNDKNVRFYHVSKDIDPITHKANYSDAVNAIDSRLLYHAINILNNQSDRNINKYATVYKKSKINGINLRFSNITIQAEKNNDYSQEYNILNIDNVRDMLER